MKTYALPTANVFDKISTYWSEIADADATKKQVAIVEGTVTPTGFILDLGCGNGRHTFALSNLGYRIVGLDISPNLLKIAKERLARDHSDAELIRADMRFLPFHSEAFEAVVSLNSSFGYLQSQEDDLLSLQEVTRVLAKEGKILIDVFNRPHMVQKYQKRPSSVAMLPKWLEYPDFFLLQKRSVKASKKLLVDLWVFRNKKTGKMTTVKHAVRLYGFTELEAMTKTAGLRLLNAFGDYDRNMYDMNSSRMILVLDKKLMGSAI